MSRRIGYGVSVRSEPGAITMVDVDAVVTYPPLAGSHTLVIAPRLAVAYERTIETIARPDR